MAEKLLVYEIWAPSWPSLKEMQKQMFRAAHLGANCVWLSGLLKSPWYDHGYDVSDHCLIDPRYGEMEDFEHFIKAAHSCGIRVLIDLVINHTSTEHVWFKEKPQYYCWSDNPTFCLGWKSLFTGKSAWQYVLENHSSYLHLFHYNQADLNWYPNHGRGNLNKDLVQEYRDIVSFWEDFGVDGFRIDAPQAINKDFSKQTLEFADMLDGRNAMGVVNAIFRQNTKSLLIAEIFDPTFGDISAKWWNETEVDYVLNVSVKDDGGKPMRSNVFDERLRKMSKVESYMCELESHDSPRFSLENCFNKDWVILQMFSKNIKAVCLYQGQELGLGNPTKEELPDKQMLELDIQTAMRFVYGADLDELRKTSRANARIPIPEDFYKDQIRRQNSHYNFTKEAIKAWKNY